jgi:hypothetical protein
MKKHRLDLEIKPKEIISKERLKGRKWRIEAKSRREMWKIIANALHKERNIHINQPRFGISQTFPTRKKSSKEEKEKEEKSFVKYTPIGFLDKKIVH